MDEQDKKIDESWKEKASKEKETTQKEDGQNLPEPDFKFFITTLAMQAAIALGEAPNPLSNKEEKNLNQAKFIIDTLDILKEKTKGNLDKEEEKLLEDVLYGLRVSFLNKSKETKV